MLLWAAGLALAAAACGDDATTYDEARYGALAEALCGEPQLDTAAGAMRWRSLAVGSSFTTSCDDPRIPLCVGHEGEPPPTESIPAGSRRAFQVYAEPADPSRGRSIAVELVDVEVGRVGVGELPLLRDVRAPEIVDVIVAPPGANNGFPPLEGGADVLVRRLAVADDGGGRCTFTVEAATPPTRRLDLFESLCGPVRPVDGVAGGLSRVAPVSDPERDDGTSPAFLPTRPAHYWDFWRDVCHNAVAIPVCVEVLDAEITRVVVTVGDPGAGDEGRESYDVVERDGSRWAFGRFFRSLGDDRDGASLVWSFEGFAPGDALRFEIGEQAVETPPIPAFRVCDF